MQQIKIFKGIENDLPALEIEVNQWIASSGARIVNIFGNISPQTHASSDAPHGLTRSEFPPSDILIVVHYERD